MNKITYNTLGQMLIKALPELRDAYDKSRGWDEGPHVVFEDALGPRLREALRDPVANDDFLQVLRHFKPQHARPLQSVQQLAARRARTS
jgi:hypothetical protein